MCGENLDKTSQEQHAPRQPPPQLAALFVDSHCHPTDDPSAYTSSTIDELSSRINDVSIARLVCMSTNARDQSMVAGLAVRHPDKVIPCFGWHPWFAHQISLSHPVPSKHKHYHDLFNIYDSSPSAQQQLDSIWEQLPEPVSLQDVCQGISDNFERFPNALLGEVGIDRAFRMPRTAWNYDPQKPQTPVLEPRLTKLKTPQAHQLSVLHAQIQIALQYRRNISLHSVQAGGLTVDLLSSLRNTDPTSFGAVRLSLHSCTLDNNVVKSLMKKYPNVYVGFSSTINRKQIAAKECLATVHPSRALMESDYHTVKGIPGFLLEATEYFSQLHALDIEAAAQQLRSNWDAFYSPKSCQDESSDDSDDDDSR